MFSGLARHLQPARQFYRRNKHKLSACVNRIACSSARKLKMTRRWVDVKYVSFRVNCRLCPRSTGLPYTTAVRSPAIYYYYLDLVLHLEFSSASATVCARIYSAAHSSPGSYDGRTLANRTSRNLQRNVIVISFQLLVVTSDAPDHPCVSQ